MTVCTDALGFPAITGIGFMSDGEQVFSLSSGRCFLLGMGGLNSKFCMMLLRVCFACVHSAVHCVRSKRCSSSGMRQLGKVLWTAGEYGAAVARAG